MHITLLKIYFIFILLYLYIIEIYVQNFLNKYLYEICRNILTILTSYDEI